MKNNHFTKEIVGYINLIKKYFLFDLKTYYYNNKI